MPLCLMSTRPTRSSGTMRHAPYAIGLRIRYHASEINGIDASKRVLVRLVGKDEPPIGKEMLGQK